MRLTCPNCEAQYEVPDEVIPPEGRDVQCSNCGDTWYQTSPDMAPSTTTEAAPAEDTVPESQPDPEPTIQQATSEPQLEADADDQDLSLDSSDPEPTADPEPTLDPEPEIEAEPEGALSEDHPQEAPPNSGLARGMDPSVTGILREEAERETRLRAAESASLESQPELGLDSAPGDETSRRAHQARDRMARMKGENPALLAAAESGSRRGLLPDIEEINSTLRASGDPVTAPAAATEGQHPSRSKSGFSRGFAIVLLLVLGLVMIYANAPKIAESLPQADPYLSSYVALVDQARLWLDAKASGMLPTE
ncbi:MAG: thioredoxin [Rhodobacteraceae bacterium]|nr:MAG: thioredoxin [Paracoccaceae bacterium]